MDNDRVAGSLVGSFGHPTSDMSATPSRVCVLVVRHLCIPAGRDISSSASHQNPRGYSNEERRTKNQELLQFAIKETVCAIRVVVVSYSHSLPMLLRCPFASVVASSSLRWFSDFLPLQFADFVP